jgi:hypothetical protein
MTSSAVAVSEGQFVRDLVLIVGRPKEAAGLCKSDEALRSLALVSLALLAVGCGAFGLVLGWVRSPLQGFYAALKLPLAWLITLSVCAPAYYALSATFGSALRFRTICAAVLVATGRASSVLLALLPVLWFASVSVSDTDRGYHQVVSLAIVLYAGSGLAALGVMREALGGRSFLLLACVGLFMLAAGQAAWTLRPFVGRPADDRVPFLRPAEDTFVDVVPRALRSSTGSYSREAPHDSRRAPPHHDHSGEGSFEGSVP